MFRLSNKLISSCRIWIPCLQFAKKTIQEVKTLACHPQQFSLWERIFDFHNIARASREEMNSFVASSTLALIGKAWASSFVGIWGNQIYILWSPCQKDFGHKSIKNRRKGYNAIENIILFISYTSVACESRSFHFVCRQLQPKVVLAPYSSWFVIGSTDRKQ